MMALFLWGLVGWVLFAIFFLRSEAWRRYAERLRAELEAAPPPAPVDPFHSLGDDLDGPEPTGV